MANLTPWSSGSDVSGRQKVRSKSSDLQEVNGGEEMQNEQLNHIRL